MNGRIARLARLLAAGGCLLLSLPGCQCSWQSCCELLQRWPDAADESGPAPGGRLCSRCGRPIPGGVAGGEEAGTPAAYYNHPRFHPVPTQPVFTPRCDMMAATPGNRGMDSLESDPSNPMLRPIPSTPGGRPEEIPVPLPALPRTEQGASVPAQLVKTSPESSSWLFASPTQLRRIKDPEADSLSDSAAESRTLR